MAWERGRERVQQLIDKGELELVVPSEQVSERLLTEAAAHLGLARLGTTSDTAGALQLAYDAARKACGALLAIQGMRATTRGGHIAVVDAVRAQFNDATGVAAFGRVDRLRRRRNESEYPSLTTPGVTSAEATQALDVACEVVDAATKLLRTGRLGIFR